MVVLPNEILRRNILFIDKGTTYWLKHIIDLK